MTTLRIPERFTVHGREWTVVRPETLVVDGEECVGLCDYAARRVTILAGLMPDHALEVFAHEAIHAVFPAEVVSARTEERIVAALEEGVIDIVRAMTQGEP